MRWQCTKCKEYKDENNFYKHKLHSKNGLTSHCKSCINQYIKNSRDRINKWRNDTKDDRNLYQRKRNGRLRDEFLDRYGNKCVCCGESEKVFLALDHINGQRGRRKDNPYDAYTKAIKNCGSKEYRILCHNCNQATKFGRTCPHQLSKEL